MTINYIIEQLYSSQELDNCIRKMVRQDLQADFKQELFLKIYDIPADRIIQLNQRGELKFYIVRSLINLVKNNSSVYNRNYIRPERERVAMFVDTDERSAARMNKAFTEFHDPDEMDQRIEKEDKELELLNEFHNGLEDAFGTFYYKELAELVAVLGGMRKVSRQTGIPIASISEAMKKTRNYLKNKCYNDAEDINGIY